MGSSLALIEQELTPRLPVFAQVLPPQLPAARLMRTVMVACERNADLLECTAQSIINSAMTAAVLGLEVDGITGQGFLIPYKVKGVPTAQFQLGYKGYPTIAARSGMSVNAGVMREGDRFTFELGSDPFVRHQPSSDPKIGRKIMWAWATGTAHGRPPIVAVMSYEEVLQIRAKSKGAARTDSPWNDENGPGHEAMVMKTAIRRLGRTVPIVSMQLAAAMEDQQDLGRAVHLDPGGAMRVVGESATPYPERVADGAGEEPPAPPSFEWLMGSGEVRTWPNASAWAAAVSEGLKRATNDEGVRNALKNNNDRIQAVKKAGFTEAAALVERVFVERGIFLEPDDQGSY